MFVNRGTFERISVRVVALLTTTWHFKMFLKVPGQQTVEKTRLPVDFKRKSLRIHSPPLKERSVPDF